MPSYFTLNWDRNMNKDIDTLISKAELSEDHTCLYLHTKNEEDCNCLWSQLSGQLRDNTEGRKPIQYTLIPENNPPESLVLELDFKKDLSQLVLLLKYLEFELKKFEFLSEGTTDSIQKQITSKESTTSNPNPFK